MLFVVLVFDIRFCNFVIKSFLYRYVRMSNSLRNWEGDVLVFSKIVDCDFFYFVWDEGLFYFIVENIER